MGGDAAGDDADHYSQNDITGQAFQSNNKSGQQCLRHNIAIADGCYGDDAEVKRVYNCGKAFSEIKSRFPAEVVVKRVKTQVYDRKRNNQIDEKVGKFADVFACCQRILP